MTIATVIDVFPSQVSTPEGTLDNVRAISDGTSLWLFQRAGNTAKLVASTVTEPFTVGDSGARGPWTFTDTAGNPWVVLRSGSCGCGDALKRATVDSLMALVTSDVS